MFGTELAKKRKELGMTQKQFAEYVGRSVRTISHWEQGNIVPDAATRLELCRMLGINLEMADMDYDSDLFPDEQQLLRIYRCLDMEGKNLIQHVANVLNGYKIRENQRSMAPRLKAYAEGCGLLKKDNGDERSGDDEE